MHFIQKTDCTIFVSNDGVNNLRTNKRKSICSLHEVTILLTLIVAIELFEILLSDRVAIYIN